MTSLGGVVILAWASGHAAGTEPGGVPSFFQEGWGLELLAASFVSLLVQFVLFLFWVKRRIWNREGDEDETEERLIRLRLK
jgi:hypothetical protein